jgi:hypothetical protein
VVILVGMRIKLYLPHVKPVVEAVDCLCIDTCNIHHVGLDLSRPPLVLGRHSILVRSVG